MIRSIRALNLLAGALLMLGGLSAMPQQVAAVEQPAQQPTKAVQPPSGKPGTTFTFFATGLNGNAEFAYWVTAPNGTVIGSDSYRTRSFGDRADWSWTSPGDAPTGTWLMVIQRLGKSDDTDKEKKKKQDESQTIAFVISADGSAPANPPASPPANPAQPPAGDQAVAPSPGAPGAEFSFFATGFSNGERVGYWVNAPDGTVLSSGGWAVEANSNGRADWRWQSKTDSKPGYYSMVARGKNSGVERVIAFEIR